ncbi:MAG: PilZ domain-containing protein [Candidatus Omnitrophota bacterium]
MSNQKEKRKHKRMRKPAIIRFQQKVPENVGTIPSEWEMGAVLNIGAGGVLFYHKNRVEPDMLLELKIYLHNPDTSLDCVGKVVRVEEIPHMYLIAAVYTEIEDEDRELLSRMAENFHPEPLIA